MTTSRPDFLIRNAQGYPIAVVEVKNRQNLSPDVAKKLRSNMVARGVPSQVPYFLLLSQDVGFLWNGTKQDNPDALPSYEFPMNKIVSRYFKDSSEKRLYGEVFELLVLQWLNDLMAGIQKASEEPEKTLALSGFNESIQGATIVPEEKL
ncbi:MAG TPA: hypothetical protein VNG51_17040 [Ktedonobacteraceae bacterium]|nr:hypothetical protein [Ktedonobacteraceae bacterium]